MVGRLVTLENVTYGNSVGGKEIFCLFYPNPNLNHSKAEAWNRVFLSSPTTRVSGEDYTFGITTWALTKDRFAILAKSGVWDDVEIGDGSGTVGSAMTSETNFGYVIPYKDEIISHPGAQSVSHYKQPMPVFCAIGDRIFIVAASPRTCIRKNIKHYIFLSVHTCSYGHAFTIMNE